MTALVVINACISNVSSTLALPDGKIMPGLGFNLAKLRVSMFSPTKLSCWCSDICSPARIITQKPIATHLFRGNGRFFYISNYGIDLIATLISGIFDVYFSNVLQVQRDGSIGCIDVLRDPLHHPDTILPVENITGG